LPAGFSADRHRHAAGQRGRPLGKLGFDTYLFRKASNRGDYQVQAWNQCLPFVVDRTNPTHHTHVLGSISSLKIKGLANVAKSMTWGHQGVTRYDLPFARIRPVSFACDWLSQSQHCAGGSGSAGINRPPILGGI
jgi:hypothetical protein